MSQGKLVRSLGLGGAVSILIGYIIGASIFVLTGPLAFKTGPALWMSYLIASVPSLFMAVVAAQVGSAVPTSGANYVLASRALSPFWGFIYVWAIMLSTLIGVPLLAYGFAEYLGVMINGLNSMVTAVVITLIFCLINILGVQLMGWVQALMVIIFMGVLILFGIGGLFHINSENLVPLMPNGFGAIIMCAIPAYFSYLGYMIITEMGEEIKKPSRNIPLAILISFIIVLVSYMLVSFVLTGLLPWNTLGETQGAVAVAAQTFLPDWISYVIVLGVLCAAFTSINAVLATSARDLYALAKDRLFPGMLAKTSTKLKTPVPAILIVTLLGIVGILLGAGIEKYALAAVMGIMICQLVVAISVIRLKKKLPQHYANSSFKLNTFWRLFWSVGLVVFSIFYLLIGFTEDWVSVSLFLFIILGIGGLFYVFRKKQLQLKGITMVDIFEKNFQGSLAQTAEKTED